MKNETIQALLIAGGNGTRLWPVSRLDHPKQLQPFISPKPLIAQSIERLSPVIKPENIWIVTGKSYVNRIIGLSPEVPSGQIIAEPFPIGTNLAVGLGAFQIYKKNPEATILVGWADSYIGNEKAFHNAVESAQILSKNFDGVIIGVPPTSAATEYGYIECGRAIEKIDDAYAVGKFEEKPDAAHADVFFQSGRHLWNTGISVWNVSKLLDLMRKLKPDHYEALAYVSQSTDRTEELLRMKEVFQNLEPSAIDTAIFEKADNLATIAAEMDWSDIGNWSAIYEVQARQTNENVTRGEVVALDTNTCLIYSQKKMVATLGVSDLIIVETDDAMLVVHKNETARLKELYERVKTDGGAKYL